jgi:capsular exopolysaccharide synthesis family protein
VDHLSPGTKPDKLDLASAPDRSLLTIIWRRKSAICLGLVLGLAAGYVFYVATPPVYQSNGQILVWKKNPDSVTGVDTRAMDLVDYMGTQQALVRSPMIVEKAIKKHKLDILPSFAGRQENLTHLIVKNLAVIRNAKTIGSGNENILNLSFRGQVRDDCAKVLEAVIDSYKDSLEETYQDNGKLVAALITKAEEKLLKQLTDKKIAYQKFRNEAPLLFLRGKEGFSPGQDRLASVEAKRVTILVRRAELQGQLAAIGDCLKNGGSQEAILAMIATWSAHAEGGRQALVLTLQEQLYPLLQEEQKLLETKGQNHPEVIAIRNRIEVAKSYLAGPSGPYRHAGSASIDLYREFCQQQIRHCDIAEKMLADVAKREEEVVRAQTGYELKHELLSDDIKRVQELYDTVLKQLNHINIAKEVGTYEAKAIMPPTIGQKVAPNPLLIFPVAALVGLLLGASFAFLAELGDKSLRRPEDIRHLGLAVVGVVPPIGRAGRVVRRALPLGTILDSKLCSYFRPDSPEAEAYRSVRTTLYFGGGKGHRIIQITSPNEGDGKTLLAANLAVTIAQSGKRVVLVDADLRRPGQHKLFGMSAKAGLAAVLSGEIDLADVVQPGGVPGLSVLPAGPCPPNPAELLTGSGFKEVLETLRGQYDFVLVDTPALLAVTDPAVVAPRVDGVLLSLCPATTNRPQAEQAKELLSALKATLIGVVVNRMRGTGGTPAYRSAVDRRAGSAGATTATKANGAQSVPSQSYANGPVTN